MITAMTILDRCRRAESDKARLRERAEMYRDTAGRVTGSLTGVGGRSTGKGDRYAALMGEIDAAERALKQREREYAAEVAAACQLLDTLPPLECAIMRRYYVSGWSLHQIAMDMQYSYGYVRRRKGDACRQLRGIPPSTVRAMLPDWYGRLM